MLPVKLDNYVLVNKVKYDINRVVNYSNFSADDFVFSSSLNKINEHRTFAEAATDSRWIEAIHQEMEVLNRNKT